MPEPVLVDRLKVIEELFQTCNKAWLAVSFIRSTGIQILRPMYLQIDEVKVLFDSKQRITEKEALKILLDDGAQLRTCRVSTSYHPKVWLFRIEDEWKAIVGSMNVSAGGLTENIEACVLLRGEETIPFRIWFDDLWNNEEPVDEAFINSLPDAIKPIGVAGGISSPIVTQIDIGPLLTGNKIKEFIRGWTHDTYHEGQRKRKTGWTFRPAHGEINQAKLLELQRILNIMFPRAADVCTLVSDDDARKIFMQANITHQRTQTGLRNLLVRRQLNYMDTEKLGFVKRIGTTWDRIKITSKGILFKSSHPDKLMQFAESTIAQYRWFGVPIHSFTIDTLNVLPDNKISFNEAFLFLRHGGINDYSYTEPEDVAKLILTHRDLSGIQKNQIWNQMEQWVYANDTSHSKTSFDNMKNNWVQNILNDLALSSKLQLDDTLTLHLI